MAEEKPTSIARHYLRYLNTNVLITLSQFISYPILVRMLTDTDYGIFGYFQTITLIWVAVLKLGTQQSIVRFYSAYCGHGDQKRERQFYASLVVAPALISFCLCLILLGGLGVFWHFHELPYAKYLFIVLILGQISVFASLIENLIRARELSLLYSFFMVVSRYMQLGITLAIVFFIAANAMTVYVSQLIGGVLVLVWLAYWAIRNSQLNIRDFDGDILRQAMSFGLPLVLSELSFVALAYADRVMIKQMMGSFDQVGIYNIGYQLAMYVGLFMRQSLFQAFEPSFVRIYEKQGPEAIRETKDRLVRLLTYVAAAGIAGFLVVGRDAFIIASGEAKAASVPVFIWVGIGYLIQPVMSIAAYGLILAKKSKTISGILIGSAGFNIILNYFMIPRLGIMGPVYATLASYLLMGILQLVFCPGDLRAHPKAEMFLKPLALALVLGLAGWGVMHLPYALLRLTVMGILFVALFVIPAFYIDTTLRRLVAEKLPARFQKRFVAIFGW